MRNFRRLICSLVLLGAILGAEAAGAIAITDKQTKGAFPIVGADGTVATFVVDPADAEVVRTAAEAVAADVALITDRTPACADALKGVKYPVIAGTLGQSPLIDNLAKKGKISAKDIAGKWEAYGLRVVEKPAKGVDRALVVYGSTPRGTAYGLFEISKLAGVSPYVWWADVKPEKRDFLYASEGETIVGEPSVKWRGIFINDEDFALQPWAARGLDRKYRNIGPNTYAKVMELLLRLRANVLWPAMHMSSEAFWANKDNIPVAKKYDIALGSSHCGQMLRDNEWEWRHAPWNGNNEDWNYVTNKEKIQRYWEERVEESKGISAMYTLGMRGVHDWGIGGYPTTEDKVRGLTEIIAFQRDLLAKHIGDPTTVPQIFIPYKEVLEAYNAGLEVPDDVIITWVDDNHGYIRQLPTAEEQKRKGGHGIYYHVSYWGTPNDYLWLASHSPSLMSYELVKGYENGIKDLWVINVGDIKPAEEELEFCMDLAWDVDRWRPEKAHGYNREWAARTFGDQYADRIADIKKEYYDLAASGKPEHILGVNFTYDEMESRVGRYLSLVEKVEALAPEIPERLQDAYFEMIEYPVKGAAWMNEKILRARQSQLLGAAGQTEKALDYLDLSDEAYRNITLITDKYNTGIAGGKWKGMMNYHPKDLRHQYKGQPTTLYHGRKDVTDVALLPESSCRIPAANYKGKRGNVARLEDIGTAGCSMAVWPLDYTHYNAAEAPYLEYTVPVKAGLNEIEARFLPFFPIHSGDPLDVAISVNGGEPEVSSLRLTAQQGKWNTTTLRGYNEAMAKYMADSDGEATVRVYLMDPGLVLSEIYVDRPYNPATSLTESLLVNPDFELDAEGNVCPGGETRRGVPYGWTINTPLSGDSYGVNGDGVNLHGDNLCWISSSPMPEGFELSQTIPADKLEEGDYLIRCRLWVDNGLKGNCRLFANDNVQYYGYEEDYSRILDPAETATFAGYGDYYGYIPVLMDMAVIAHVDKGEDLKLGIRSSNRRGDNTRATDHTGWFKVDNFRIDRLK